MLQRLSITRLGIAILCTILLVYLGLTEERTSRIGVAFLILYIFLQLLEISLKDQYRRYSLNYERVMIYLFPIALVLVIFLSVLPVSKDPIKWKFVKNAWNAVKEFSTDLFDDFSYYVLGGKHKDKAFSLSFMGYSAEDGDISGDIYSNDGLALQVSVERLRKPNLYIRGNVKNVYTGRGWEEEFTEPEYLENTKEYAIGAYELLYFLYREEKLNEAEDFLAKRTLDITFQNIETTSIFYPAFTYRYSQLAQKKYIDLGSNLQYEKVQKKENQYDISYFDLDLGNPQVQEMIRKQNGFSYNSSKEVPYLQQTIKSNAFPVIDELDDIEGFLSKRADYIMANYLSLPESLPSRVEELTIAITRDYKTEYEKLRAIEGYLNNYAYTLSPKEVRKGADLVDSFLFDYQEGYCTYFASAMAVMARTIGIPTRFVQGFLVPVEINQYKTFDARNSNAHAWIEAYLEGVGWIAFEPTPAYNGELYTSWVEKPQFQEGTVSEITVEPEGNPYITQEEFEEIGNINVHSKTVSKEVKGFVTVFLGFIGIGIVTIVGFYCYRIYRYQGLYERANYNEKVFMDIHYIMCLLEKRGWKIETGETFYQYIKRINQKQIKLMEVADIYMRLRYHEEKVSGKEQLVIANVKKHLRMDTKEQVGTWRYLLICLKIILIGYGDSDRKK